MRPLRAFAPPLAALALCPLIAALAPAPDGPLARGRDVADLERGLGLFVEPSLVGWVAARPWLLALLGGAYLAVHVTLTGAALVVLWLRRPDRYGPIAATFVAAQSLTVIAYLVIPTAPPRMLAAHGLPDTLAAVWGGGANGAAAAFQSPYAAMPSGHVVFAIVAALAVRAAFDAPWARRAALLYPPAVATLTVATANHFWLDALAAAAVTALAYAGVVAAGRRSMPAAAYASSSSSVSSSSSRRASDSSLSRLSASTPRTSS
jgi:PAP2 superfamily protein